MSNANPTSEPLQAHHPRRRRWRVPAPYLRSVEAVEGVAILEEFPGALGLLVWQCVRDVSLWALTPPDERQGLFSADAQHRRMAALLLLGAQAREVEEPVRALARMLSRPADTDAEHVLLACQRLSQWAEAADAPATALACAQAAALATPGSARACLRVGQLTRRRAEYVRAEGWLQRAIVLARQNREREVHAWAYTALGTVHFLRGNLPKAEHCHLRALRIAERFSLRARMAAALHDLFAVCGETQRLEAAMQYARQAFTAYGPNHARLPSLAHDVAHLWLIEGQFGRALPVLESVLPHVEPHQQVVVTANAARAAGAVGDRDAFSRNWTRTLAVFDQEEPGEQHASALLNLAHGAASIGDLPLARGTAQRALRLAEMLQEHKVAFMAEAFLQSLEHEVRSKQTSCGVSVPQALEDPAMDQFSIELAEAVACLPVG